MEDFELVRRMVEIEGLSRREVARRLGVSRNSIHKILEHSAPVPYTRKAPRARPTMDPFVALIRTWLEADRMAPRKQRHTAMRVFERLQTEHQFAGSRRAVSDVVKMLRGDMQPPEIFVPIDHSPGGEFQIDWGEVTINLNSQATSVMIFCARSAYSKATFVRAYMRDDMLSFMDGHVWLLNRLGGVPVRLAYDNLSSAVTKVLQGRERTLNPRFLAMRSHYLYETRFCNVGRGNEKGHVENSVKRAERTYLTPVPSVTNLEVLNEQLTQSCFDDLRRVCPKTQKTYGQLLEEERLVFRALPVQHFSASIVHPQKSDRQSTVQWEGARYSVPIQYACQNISVRAFFNRVEVLAKNQIVASHAKHEPGQWSLELEHYLPVLERKPGLLDCGIPFKNKAWSAAHRLMRSELEFRLGADGTRQFLNMLLLVKEHPWSLVSQAIERCAERRAFNEQAVRLELLQLVNGPSAAALQTELDLSRYPQLQSTDQGTRSLTAYDALYESVDMRSSMDDRVSDVLSPAAYTSDHGGHSQSSEFLIEARSAHDYQEERHSPDQTHIARYEPLGESAACPAFTDDPFGVLESSQAMLAR